jgi:Hemerythrin HHE cation binding domain
MDRSNASSALARSARLTAVEHREQVQRVLVALEAALASPAPGRLAQWREVVARRLHELRGEFARHVEITEGADGLYDEIVALAPEHARAIDVLRHEHTEIEAGIRALLTTVASRAAPGDPEVWVEAQRAAGTTLLGRLVRHRQRGADLTWRAYNVELGSG